MPLREGAYKALHGRRPAYFERLRVLFSDRDLASLHPKAEVISSPAAGPPQQMKKRCIYRELGQKGKGLALIPQIPLKIRFVDAALLYGTTLIGQLPIHRRPERKCCEEFSG